MFSSLLYSSTPYLILWSFCLFFCSLIKWTYWAINDSLVMRASWSRNLLNRLLTEWMMIAIFSRSILIWTFLIENILLFLKLKFLWGRFKICIYLNRSSQCLTIFLLNILRRFERIRKLLLKFSSIFILLIFAVIIDI